MAGREVAELVEYWLMIREAPRRDTKMRIFFVCLRVTMWILYRRSSTELRKCVTGSGQKVKAVRQEMRKRRSRAH